MWSPHFAFYITSLKTLQKPLNGKNFECIKRLQFLACLRQANIQRRDAWKFHDKSCALVSMLLHWAQSGDTQFSRHKEQNAYKAQRINQNTIILEFLVELFTGINTFTLVIVLCKCSFDQVIGKSLSIPLPNYRKQLRYRSVKGIVSNL